MSERTQLFHRVTIIGVGLIGGSLGMAIRKNRLAQEVIGLSRKDDLLMQALKNGAIDKSSQDLKKAVEGAELVIIAAPIKGVISTFPLIAPYLRRGAIVTDVGSTKANIVEAAQKYLPAHVHYVGAHPLAGSEKKGVEHGHAELFQDSLCILTPLEKTNRAAVEKIKFLWERIGAVVKFLPPGDHDKILAFISHLPHLMAFGLLACIPRDYLSYATRGFKEMTRVASSDPDLWTNISIANSKHLIQSLDEFVKTLSAFRKALASGQEAPLTEYFKKAKEARDGIAPS